MNFKHHSERLGWNSNGYGRFDLHMHPVPGDGNCLIHSICYCFYKPYQMGILNGKVLSRNEIVRDIRRSLSRRLTETDPKSGKTYYQLLGLSKDVPEYSLEHLEKVIDSTASLSYTEIYIIEILLDVNVYVLEESTGDVYVTGDVKKERDGVVVYHTFNHFDAVSIKHANGRHSMYFEHDHPLLVHLREREEKYKK